MPSRRKPKAERRPIPGSVPDKIVTLHRAGVTSPAINASIISCPESTVRSAFSYYGLSSGRPGGRPRKEQNQ